MADNRREYVNQKGLSRAAIFNAVAGSLRRLGTDYIDVLQVHRFDPDTPVEETMRALHDLVQAGKVRPRRPPASRWGFDAGRCATWARARCARGSSRA